MTTLSKSLIAAGAVLVAGGIAATVLVMRRRARPEVPGPMSLRAIHRLGDSRWLGRSVSAQSDPDVFDPEEIPSEHAEINDLRRQMP